MTDPAADMIDACRPDRHAYVQPYIRGVPVATPGGLFCLRCGEPPESHKEQRR